MTVRLFGFPGRLPHLDTGLLGSASMIVTPAPLSASSEASNTALVDLPAPPLLLAKTMVGIGGILPVNGRPAVYRRSTVARSSAVSQPSSKGRPSGDEVETANSTFSVGRPK